MPPIYPNIPADGINPILLTGSATRTSRQCLMNSTHACFVTGHDFSEAPLLEYKKVTAAA
jgi:hypothetical protein